MIELKIFLLQFCAHFLADFVFQPQKMSDNKSKKVFSINHLWEALGLIIAAKSILRFNATHKSEYVLVGTLVSFGIAVFCGILINSV